MYLLKLAFRPWRLAPLSQLFSALAVGFLLLSVGFLYWMNQGLKTVLFRLEGEQVVTAYLDSSLSDKNEAKVVDSIRTALASEGNFDVKWVTAPQFITLLKKEYPDLGRQLEDLGQEMLQVVPRYVSISGILPDSVLEKVKKIQGVESVESSKDRYHQIVGAFSALRLVVRVLMGGICLALLTGLIHLSRMNAYLHRDALTLLRFWGAENITLASPGLISGLMVGILGGAIACGGWMTVGVWLTRHIRTLSSMLKTMPPVQANLAILLLLVGSTVGIISGMLGSLSASHLAHDGGLRD